MVSKTVSHTVKYNWYIKNNNSLMKDDTDFSLLAPAKKKY